MSAAKPRRRRLADWAHAGVGVPDALVDAVASMRRIAGRCNASGWLLAATLLGCPAGGFASDDAEPVLAGSHMVVAANPHASEAGLRILRAGGSAVDAAIAVQLVLSMVEPQSSGIGGGAFLLHFDAPGASADPAAPDERRESNERPGSNERAESDERGGSDDRAAISFYDGRETAPAAATPDMFLDDSGRPAPFFSVGAGGLSVGVPGVMRMLEAAHDDHGRLPWHALFTPAIELAEQGFEISPRLHSLLEVFKGFARAEHFRNRFYDAEGEPHPVGHRLVDPDYAATLRLLAADGAEPMYSGDLAGAIVQEIRENNVGAGRMTLADLTAYRARKSAPLCSPYRQWRVCGPQPPSSGGVTVHQILGILEHLNAPAFADDPVRAIHLLAEASRLAFADRNHYLADPDFVDLPVAALLSPAYLRERAALVDPDRAMRSVAPGEPDDVQVLNFASGPPSDLTSTSHFSIVDRWGNAVAMTTSVQSAFGSQLMVGGFILNNQLTDFSFEPEIDGRPVANRAEANKRPLSSMAPTLVLDGDDRLHLVIGSPGGTRIIGYVAQTIVAVLDWGRNVQQAISAPRIIAQVGPLEIEEDSALLEHADALRAIGHNVATRNLNSGLHGITIDHTDGGRVLAGGVDPRREGVALGD